MSLMQFEYDPFRGGFCLCFGGFDRSAGRKLFGGFASVYVDERNRVAAVESFWDHGGLPLRGIHQAQNPPYGEFAVEGAELRLSHLLLRQSHDNLELWFSHDRDVPRSHWSRQHEAEAGVTFWFSTHKAEAGWPVPGIGGRGECPLLAGVALELPLTVITAPVSALRLSPGDFK